mgnify:FL=1
MELSWMKTFVTVSELGSFRKAAEALYVSQPTVTVHIKALENELGVVLFERNQRMVKLTEEGRLYLAHAKKLLQIHEEGINRLQSVAQGYKETLRLAISPQIADTIMPFVLKKYLEEHPNVEVDVNVMESSQIENAVINENVDLGLSLIESYEPTLTQKVLYEDQVVFVAPHDGHDLETAPASDVDLLFQQYYLLTHNHPVYWNTLLHQLKTKFKNIRTMRVSQNHITKRFIISGLGVSFLPKSTIRREILEGRMIEVPINEIELPTVKTYVIMKYDHERERRFLNFVERYHFQ